MKKLGLGWRVSWRVLCKGPHQLTLVVLITLSAELPCRGLFLFHLLLPIFQESAAAVGAEIVLDVFGSEFLDAGGSTRRTPTRRVVAPYLPTNQAVGVVRLGHPCSSRGGGGRSFFHTNVLAHTLQSMSQNVG